MLTTTEFTDDDLVELQAMFAGSSLDQLEALKSRLREVKQMIYREIASREVLLTPLVVSSSILRVCDNKGCGKTYTARVADLKRGWGKCCSKSCSGSHRLRQNPSHGYLHRGDHDDSMEGAEGGGWDAHKCWKS